MWWRLGVLAAATVGLIALLFWPMPVDIVVQMPPARGAPRVSSGQFETTVETGAAWFSALVVGLILLGALWVGRGIVRKHRRPS